MNWSLFFATITWSLTVISFIFGFFAVFMLEDEVNRSLKKCLIILGGAVAVFTLCISVLAGMGWI